LAGTVGGNDMFQVLYGADPEQALTDFSRNLADRWNRGPFSRMEAPSTVFLQLLIICFT
jgi:hypothetical protein